MRKINTLSFQRATRSTSRDINRQIALNIVREHAPISRAELARRMNVGRGVATSLVGELIAEGAVYEGDTIDAPRGRRPTMLYVRSHDRYAIAIDIRLTRTTIMLTDFAGRELALDSFETLFAPDELVEELARRTRRILDASAPGATCEGMGVVVPGMVDHRMGRVLRSPQLGWRDVNVRDMLAEATGMPVEIENAPIACALAKMWLGGTAAGTDFAFVTVSDGVGVGVVVNGEVVRGHDHTAGEFGHVPLDPSGPRCLCGARGCWEAYTSNVATLARYLGRELEPTAVRALQSMPLTIVQLIERARSGDERARASILETGKYLGQGVSMVVAGLNPARIYVGGEITGAWDMIEDTVRERIRERALTSATAATPVIPEPVDARPRLRGAAALVAAPVFAAPRIA